MILSRTTIRTLQVVNVLIFLATLYVNYLANALPLGGKNTGELSEQYPNLFTPAGLTFSIWGVIYFTTLLFTVYQLAPLVKPAWRSRIEPVVDRLGGGFIFLCLCNIGWLFAWHYEQVGLSVAIMAAYLLTLIIINHLLRPFGRTTPEKWLIRLPFGLHLGWISIATIANVTAWLVDRNWKANGWPPEVWAVVMIGVGTLLTLLVLRRTANVPYGLVVIWAFVGIILKRTRESPDPSQPILIMAGLGIALVLIAVVVRARRWGQI